MRPFRPLVAACALVPAIAGAQVRSAPVTDVRYAVTFTAALGVERALDVTMTFNVNGRDPVLLSIPTWTPGSYEISNYARYVSRFGATEKAKALRWDKLDPDTWRVYPDASGEVAVAFHVRADTLDNGGSFARDEFAFFNGTNVFLYPEGRPLDFPSQVRVVTEPAWRVSTGLPESNGGWRAATYHELVDHPFFVGRFDRDSAMVGGVWFGLNSYPVGSVNGQRRKRLLDQMAKAIPTQIAVFGENPWKRYEIFQVGDSSFGGMSALEHENSNLAVIGLGLMDEDFVPSIYAHEIFHAFNVKRLRPADLFPYRYDQWQPTPWLWVSEGITDYYADLSLVRGGVIDAAGFLATTQKKIDNVRNAPVMALEDASLQAWLHTTDEPGDLYYDKGSLAGLALDILIRDASDNANSLDTVMRELYAADWKNGKGFTSDEWWSAVSRASRGTRYKDIKERLVNRRESYPWQQWLAKAGWRIRTDSIREARLGVSLTATEQGPKVVIVAPEGAAAAAGIKPGDVIVTVDGTSTNDPAWERWRTKYATRTGTVPVGIVRDGRSLTLQAPIRTTVLVDEKLENDPAASEKAKRIREGILFAKKN